MRTQDIEEKESLVCAGVPKICLRDEHHKMWVECYVRKANTILNSNISSNHYLRRIIMNIMMLFLWQNYRENSRIEG